MFCLKKLRQEFYKHDQQSFAYLDCKAYNNIRFTTFYDREKNSLILLKKSTRLEIEINIDNYFNVATPIPNDKYKLLISFFEIKYNPESKFSPLSFFEYFNQNLTWRDNPSKEEQSYLTRKNNLEDPFAIYYKSTIDHRGKNNGHVTQKNREKVRILLPKLYEHIKNLDISIGFTSEKRESTKIFQNEIIQKL